MKNRLILFLAACLCIGGCEDAPESAAPTPKAIFILVDGIPADVVERVSTPNIDAIGQAGGYTRAYVGGAVGQESESPTISAVSYNSMLTGTWANKHNVWGNSIENPNYDYWDIYRIAKNHDPELHTAIFSTWTDNRTKLIGDSLAEAGGHKIDYAFDGFELDEEQFPHDDDYHYIRDIDAHVAAGAARYVRDHGPALSWVYLEYTDSVAHLLGDSPEMDSAVQEMDRWIGGIWESVTFRQDNLDEDWLIVVTTDHGRDDATGKDHGGQSERERTIWIATNSNALNPGFGDNSEIVDILPSIASHLGLEIPPEVRANLDGSSFVN